MKRIKKILIGIFFSLLLIPILTNNVYAETYEIPNMDNYTETEICSGTAANAWQGDLPITLKNIDVAAYDYIKVVADAPINSYNDERIYAKITDARLTTKAGTNVEYFLVNGEYSPGHLINEYNSKHNYFYDTRKINGKLDFEGTWKASRYGTSAYVYPNITVYGYASKSPVFSGDFGSGNLMSVEYIHHLPTYSGCIDKL